MRKKLTLLEVKEISLGILINIHEFCKRNGIKYSLGYGTMLGAVRHKGFIPWDDDIDILMMRDDYEKFISIYESPEFEIIDHNRNRKYILPYAKVVDKKTILYNSWMPNLKQGVGVDVFPVDYLGKDKEDAKKIYNRKSIWGKLFLLKVLDYRWRGFAKSLFLLCSKLLLLPITKSFLCEKLMSFSNKETRANGGVWGVIVPADSFFREAFYYHIYNNITTIEFENHHFLCISNTDEYLSKIYGDYMRLPPEDKRVSTHDSEAYYI